MKNGIKIAVIGGGSSYTPELMEGLIKRQEALSVAEIWLVDIEEGKERVEVIGDLSRRMWKAAGKDVSIYTGLQRPQALKGADFVLTQLRVGQLNARIKDERIPLLHGFLGQETNGAGGILNAFRTIPVMREIIGDMRKYCPDAWLINFTNPSGMITEAVIKHMGWEKCIGLCNVPTIAMMKEPASIGMSGGELHHQFAGINHFHWHKAVDAKGKDVTDRLLEHVNDRDGGMPTNIAFAPFPQEMLRSMGLVPCGYHRYYFMQKEMLEHSLEDFRGGVTRAEQMQDVEKALFAKYRDPNLSKKPEELSLRGGAYYSDAACECIAAIANDRMTHMVVSTRNNGAIPCLDSDSIVEVSCVITGAGALPLAWGGMHHAVKGWLQLMKAMEECVIDAAFSGDYGLALEGFMMNPLIQSGATAKLVLDELLVAHEKYLPQFSEKIKELKRQGIGTKDPVVQALMDKGL